MNKSNRTIESGFYLPMKETTFKTACISIRQCYTIALPAIICFLLYTPLCAYTGWKIVSVNQNSFTVSFSTQTGPDMSPVIFGFSRNPAVNVSYSLRIDSTAASTITAPELRALSTGVSGIHTLQWLTFTPPQSREIRSYSGTLQVVFDTPVLAGLTMNDMKLNHGVLTFTVPSKTLSKVQASIPAQPQFDKCVMIEISENGIYRIFGKDLKKAGVPAGSISKQAFRLFERDREVPLLFSDESSQPFADDEFFLFYGRRLYGTTTNYEQYSNTSVYRLFWGALPGARVAVVSGDRRKDPTDYATGVSIKAQAFRDTIRFEEDNDIRWLGNVADIPPSEIISPPYLTDNVDNWYWGIIGDKELTTFPFDLPSPARTGSAQLRINLMGLTSIDSITPDHRLKILLNNNPAGLQSIARWDGQREFVFESDTFPSNVLIAGKNTLSFLTEQTGTIDRSALNWIELIYQRDYEVINDNLVFRSSPDAPGNVIEYELSGFSTADIDLWDIEQNRSFTDFTVKSGTGNKRAYFALLFQDSINNPVTYYAQETRKRKTPELIVLDTLSDGWDTLVAIDYIVIAPDSFAADCAPLLSMHRKRGKKCAFVSIEQIYHRFSWGIRNPEAIRTFLKFCFQKNPLHPPRYLLLAGDTSHDLDKKNKTINLVPTHLSRVPGWGPGADDGYFATVNGDDHFPDLCVGRFPARNREELKIMVNKTIGYILQPQRGFWKDNLILLGGGEREFTDFNDHITGNVTGDMMNTIRMDADPDSRFYKDVSIASGLIADQVNAGVYIVNFNGHGGGNIWSDNNFFGYRDLSRLYNGAHNRGGRLPVVFSFTCLTGFFESTQYRSLGEEFIRNSAHGAICFYGASAYTSRNGNLIMNRLMLEFALNERFNSIGELINTCELYMLVLYGPQYANIVKQYNLLGDPALPFEMVPSTIQMTLRNNDLSGKDTLMVDGNCAPVGNGMLQLLVQSGAQEWNRISKELSSSTFTHTFPLKPASRSGSGIVRAYAWNDSKEVRGWVKFAKDTMMIFDVTLLPPLPEYGDSVSISGKLTSDSTAQVYCIYAQTYSSTPPSFNGVGMVYSGDSRWVTSHPIPIVYSEHTDEALVVQFRISSPNGTRESGQFRYRIGPRPDLTFTNKNLKLFWEHDSLRTKVQILNAGNKPVSSFASLLVLGSQLPSPDTIGIHHFTKPLDPGEIAQCTFSIPDTLGDIVYSAHLISGDKEITTQNNHIVSKSHINMKVLHSAKDTLYSKHKGVSVHPVSQLSQPHTVFLFSDSIGEKKPLKTSSSWAVIQGDSVGSFGLGCRPQIDMTDSLMWIFRLRVSKENSGKTGSTCVMTYDSLLSRWVANSGKVSPETVILENIGHSTGPFAPAFLDDSRAPDIQVSVYGRTLDFVDYAAKDKPFSIFLSDPSEIVPSSIIILSNNEKLSAENHSAIPTSGELDHISITAYPPSGGLVDSLAISAMDFAGNRSSRTFAYLPGRDLSIQFLSCHPNPFTAKVRPDGSLTKIRFAYSITDIAKSIDLTIYTVSGRPIRSWNYDNRIGYQEIEWDGRDRDGYRIANGTYYAKLTVNNKSRKVKKIIKIAKLEGF